MLQSHTTQALHLLSSTMAEPAVPSPAVAVAPAPAAVAGVAPPAKRRKKGPKAAAPEAAADTNGGVVANNGGSILHPYLQLFLVRVVDSACVWRVMLERSEIYGGG